MKPLTEVLSPFGYHRDVLAYLKSEETDLWKWFSSEKIRSEYADSVRMDLLKSTYRLEREAHPDLYRLADRANESLGLGIPLTLYQAQAGTGMNAALAYIPGEGHLVLVGPVATTLTPDEIVAVVAHELTHYLFWKEWDGEFHIADQVLLAIANHSRSEPSHRQTARRYRLYTELFADRGSLFVTGNPLVSIAGLVKIETGLAAANPESYLRQADEILRKTGTGTEEETHPELFIRARALKLWAARSPDQPA
jgi:Zn-dependent protease with chaperone function